MEICGCSCDPFRNLAVSTSVVLDQLLSCPAPIERPPLIDADFEIRVILTFAAVATSLA
jgi:hypothetical protein